MLTVGTAQVADAVDLYVRVHNCVEQAGPGCVTNLFGNASTMWSHTQPIKEGLQAVYISYCHIIT